MSSSESAQPRMRKRISEAENLIPQNTNDYDDSCLYSVPFRAETTPRVTALLKTHRCKTALAANSILTSKEEEEKKEEDEETGELLPKQTSDGEQRVLPSLHSPWYSSPLE